MQLALDLEQTGWGGRRKGAGRKGSGKVTHVKRVHDGQHPVHVTMKVVDGLPSLRGHWLGKLVCRHIRKSLGHRAGFRIVEFCVQSNHIHLLIEAESAVALSHGMLGLASSLARAVNAQLGRGGKLWRDRYHAHELTNPTMTRNAVRYVLQNRAHHGGAVGIDPMSSATWSHAFFDVSPALHDPPVARPQTWLLRDGWHQRGGGKLSIHERPA